MSISRSELARKLSENQRIKMKDALKIVDEFFLELTEQLKKGHQLKFSCFGKFVLQDKKERKGRNPNTGEEYPISARRVVVFHASQTLRENITHAEDKKS